MQRAWDDFEEWYSAEYSPAHARKPILSVQRNGIQELTVYDSRFERLRILPLQGNVARVYDLSHQGLRFDALRQQTGVAEKELERNLEYPQSEKILMEIEQFYLSLAFRPRDELIQNLLGQKKSSPEAGATNLIRDHFV